VILSPQKPNDKTGAKLSSKNFLETALPFLLLGEAGQNQSGVIMYRILSLINILRRGAVSGVFITTSLLILLGMGIWFYGPAFRYMDYAPFAPVANRIIAIGVLVVLWGINNYFLARRHPRKKPKQSSETTIAVRDGVDDLITLMTQSFRNCLKIMRTKWTGEEKGMRSLYALPWYLVIGPSGAGKSTLVREGDLNFPLAHLLNETQDQSPQAQELPQYWVSNEGVLFDIPGRWLDRNAGITLNISNPQDEEDLEKGGESATTKNAAAASPPQAGQKNARQRIWDAFLHLLLEARPRRPINGVIVNFDLIALARMSTRQRRQAADRIHTHLVHIAEKLGTRFTVHVVMTKLDHFAGFADYFSQTPKGDRKLPFGFSFPVYNELETDKWLEDFERSFDQFLAKANDDMIDRLYNQRELEGRRNVYIFLRQLASIAPVVREFCHRALISDRFSTPPLVRGVYFASARQEGVPFNGLLTRIAVEYHMNPPGLRAYSGGSARFFSDNLFRDVIFKEAGLAGDNKKVESRKRFILNTAIVTSVLFVLGFGFLLNEAMRDNRARTENVLAAGNDFINLPREEVEGSDESHYIAALNAIEAANHEFPNWQEKSDARRYLALYQGRRVGPEVEKAYEDLLRRRFLPAISEKIKAEIVRMGQDPDLADSDERLDALRAYLLLGQIDIRQELDARDTNAQALGRAAVLRWLQRNWQQRFEGQRTLQDDLRRHLNYVLLSNRIAAPIDGDMVAKTRADLLKIPRDVRLYRTLKSLAAKQMPGGISLRSVLGPSFDIIFKQRSDDGTRSTDIIIAHFYSKRGFHEFFVPRNDDLSIIALEDAWVTGESERVHYSDEDLENFRQKIRQAYATDYIAQWNNALNTLDIVNFVSIEHGARVIAEINGPANPFGRIIQLIKTETEIYPPEPVNLEEAQSQTELRFDANHEHGRRIARYFTPLTQLLEAQEGGQIMPFEQILASMGGLETYMRGILSSGQSSRPLALERARERASLSGNDPIFIVRRTGASLPVPFDKFFTQIATNSWRAILDAAKIDLQTVWQENVYRSFHVDLAGKYPFNAQAGEEVTLAEFQKFFGPQGDFDTFFNENLRIFVNPNTSQPIMIDGQSLNISAEFVQQLAAVRTVRDIFFNSDGVPTLNYTVEPVSMSGNISRAVLNLEGQLIPYSHGPTTPKSILWPNALSSSQDISRLSLSRQGDSQALNFQGLWSSFRLFDRAQVTEATPESVDVSFQIGNSLIKYRLRMASTKRNPFAIRSLSQLRLPEQL